jgi:hypothetical protein
MSRYEAREIDGRWAIFDTVEDRVTGRFGRGEDERRSAAAHALQMNEALLRPEAEELGFHAAIARHEAVPRRREPHGDTRRT